MLLLVLSSPLGIFTPEMSLSDSESSIGSSSLLYISLLAGFLTRFYAMKAHFGRNIASGISISNCGAKYANLKLSAPLNTNEVVTRTGSSISSSEPEESSETSESFDTFDALDIVADAPDTVEAVFRAALKKASRPL